MIFLTPKHLSALPIYIIVIILSAGLIFAGTSSISWTNLYETKIIDDPIYKEICYPESIDNKNGTIHKESCIQVIDRYQDKMITTKKMKGITDGYAIIKDGYVYDKKVIRWNIPIGDRNFDDPRFSRCMEYEIQKGVCYEI